MRRALKEVPSSLPKTGRVLAVAALAFFLLAGPAAAAIAPDAPHTSNAEDVRTTFWVMLVVSFVVGLPLVLGVIAAARRFRASGSSEEPRRLSAGRGVIGKVTGGLVVIGLAIFIFGVVMADGIRQASADPEAESVDINAVGQQWLWRYEYPLQEGFEGSEGISTTFSYHELVIPVDTTINLSIDSTDVLHIWSVPALAPQAMAVPGEVNEISFRVDEEGLYEGKSMMFSGTNTPAMRTAVKVVSAEEYQAYVEGLSNDLAAGQSAIQEQVGEE